MRTTPPHQVASAKDPYRPQYALNKAFRKVKPNRADFETFKTELATLLEGVKENESEEFHKNLIADFLKKTHYAAHFINTKGRNDLVIHEGKSANTPVGVILETKRPNNKGEMLTRADLNRKALHELVLYYLRERITVQNTGLKHLIATNTYEWFFFDASDFEKTFATNKALVKDFKAFEAGRLSGTKTEFFYNEIVKPFVEKLAASLPYTYVDLRDYQQDLAVGSESEKKLITLYKLFSSPHLLKLPFANDSNTLDRAFYAELLHIIGLTEEKSGGKKLITRKGEAERTDASLLENAILQLDTLGKLGRLEQPAPYGASRDERLFNVALELCITWINRVLFLKLLESQLKSYHKGERAGFLNLKRLPNYDDLNTLFFGILAKPVNERHPSVAAGFEEVPHLNSSLFEPTEMEHTTLLISNLRDDRALTLHSHTVLKDENGKRRTGTLNTLAYLFEFLDAFDFSSEGSQAVQEGSKTLINASVLGLIFEKINGYRDGSFFTPGFITMYMCRESIRRAALQKFNEVKGWRCRSIDELYDKIDDKREANAIINSLKICDPAVGSGHFLVSALNELLVLKGELKILLDENGKTLRDYKLEISNDELVITDDDSDLFEYNPNSSESQRIQKTFFHEKQTLIENCLFGVDINPNSVKICRLRLWIELLKHAYYREDAQLETLPNIDINIKVGNSLISRFALDADLKHALKKSRRKIEDYQNAVSTYRNAESKEQKREMERLIGEIKAGFRTEIANNDPKVIRLDNLKVKLARLEQAQLFEESAAQKREREKLGKEVSKLAAEIEEVKNDKVFENAFEWRFEFPEVLNDEGDFTGFDVILGNPPYIRIQELQKSDKRQVMYFKGEYASAGKGNYDIYVMFIEQGLRLLNKRGYLNYILPHKFFNAKYGEPIREVIANGKHLSKIVHFGDEQIFEGASTYVCLLSLDKQPREAFEFHKVDNLSEWSQHGKSIKGDLSTNQAKSSDWNFVVGKSADLFEKLAQYPCKLKDVANVFVGTQTSADDVFVLEACTVEGTRTIGYSKALDKEVEVETECTKHFLRGKQVRHYQILPENNRLIFPYSVSDDDFHLLSEDELSEKYPLTLSYLQDNKSKLGARENGKFKGEKWFAFGYPKSMPLFQKDKIIAPDYNDTASFALDTHQHYFKTGYGILPTSDKLEKTYLLGLLNSSLLFWFLTLTSTKLRGGYIRFWTQYLEPLPIRTLDLSNPSEKAVHARVSDMVAQISELHRQKAEVTGAELISLEGEIARLDAEIDSLVYELYGLTEEEVKIIERSVS